MGQMWSYLLVLSMGSVNLWLHMRIALWDEAR